MNQKWKVLVTRYFPGDAIERLKEKCDVQCNRQVPPMEKDVLKRQVKDVDILITVEDPIDSEIIDSAPRLKAIADLWGGGRNIDQDACKKRNIKIITSPITKKWLNHSETEHAMLLLLAVTRRLLEADAFVRDGKFKELEQANRDMLGAGLNGKTLGIIGGAFWSGDEMVKRAAAFNMKVQYWDRSRSELMESLGAGYEEFDHVLKTSDFIILMANGSQGYLLDAPQFDKMKRGVYLVNVTKGTFINEKELVKALKDGRVAGAGLDKLENEPFPVSGLTDLKNVVLTPHSDGALLEERNIVYESVVSQCLEIIG